MVFSFVGPPTAGKTTISSLLIREVPGLAHFSIDESRASTRTDEEAWRHLLNQCLSCKEPHIIVESSGLSPELYSVVLSHPQIIEKGLSLVRFSTSPEDIRARLVERHGDLSPSHLPAWHEYSFAEYSQPLLAGLTVDLDVDTSQMSVAESYELTLSHLLDRCWGMD